MYSEVPCKNVPYTFVRGPIVFCADMVWNEQIGNDDSGFGKKSANRCKHFAHSYSLHSTFDIGTYL